MWVCGCRLQFSWTCRLRKFAMMHVCVYVSRSHALSLSLSLSLSLAHTHTLGGSISWTRLSWKSTMSLCGTCSVRPRNWKVLTPTDALHVYLICIPQMPYVTFEGTWQARSSTYRQATTGAWWCPTSSPCPSAARCVV